MRLLNSFPVKLLFWTAVVANIVGAISGVVV